MRRTLFARRPCRTVHPRRRRLECERLEDRCTPVLGVTPFNPASPVSTLTNALLVPGSGLTLVGTPTTNLANGQAGTFTGFDFNDGANQLSLADGVILTSGQAILALGPNNSGSAGTGLGRPGDSALSTLVGAATFDAGSFTLQFTAAPGIRSIQFDFVFGSEEFPEFLNFSDAFAAYLDGTVINSSIVNNTFAQLNNTADNVSNTIRVNFNVQYDGLTRRLTAQAPLNDNIAVHTLRFVIADALDGIYDSGVFLSRLRGSTEVVSGPSTQQQPATTITGLSQTTALAGSTVNLTVLGTNFTNTSVVQLDGVNLATTFQSATQLQAVIPGTLLPAGSDLSTAQISVFTPGANGGRSNQVPFTIISPASPGQTVGITGLSQTQATAGGPGFTLTVNGFGFVAGSTVLFNGEDRPTTFVSSTQLQVAIQPSDLFTVGTAFNTADLRIRNPNGTVSPAFPFTIVSATTTGTPPTITGLSQSTGSENEAITLTVTGTGFTNNSVILLNGLPRTPTTFVSATQLRTVIPAGMFTVSDFSALSVRVFNPGTGGGGLTSTARPFTLTSAAVQSVQTAILNPDPEGRRVTATVTIPSVISATLTATTYARITVVQYTPDFANRFGSLFRIGDLFYDVQIYGRDGEATIRFYYPSTVTGSVEANLEFYFLDITRTTSTVTTDGKSEEVETVLVQRRVPRNNNGTAPIYNTADNQDGTTSGGYFQLTIGPMSLPAFSHFLGTVFVIVVPDPVPVAPPNNPPLVLGNTPNNLSFVTDISLEFARATRVLVSAGPTLTVLTGQDNQGTSSRAALTGGPDTGGPGASTTFSSTTGVGGSDDSQGDGYWVWVVRVGDQEILLRIDVVDKEPPFGVPLRRRYVPKIREPRPETPDAPMGEAPAARAPEGNGKAALPPEEEPGPDQPQALEPTGDLGQPRGAEPAARSADDEDDLDLAQGGLAASLLGLSYWRQSSRPEDKRRKSAV